MSKLTQELRTNAEPELNINPEYASLVSPLSDQEYKDLKASLTENGQYIPIIVNGQFVVLDGHHRLKACQEIGIEPKFMLKRFDDPLLEQIFVIDTNLKRRHLNNFQRIELALKARPILKLIARKNSSANLPNHKNNDLLSGGIQPLNDCKLGRVNDLIGKKANMGKDAVRQVEYILKRASEDDINKLNSGQKSIHEVYKTLHNYEVRQNLMSQKSTIKLPNNCKLYCGDFIEKSQLIPDNSIDLIFTDPPFNDITKSIEIYRQLGHLAQRVLKDGSALITYVGSPDLPKLTNALLESGLKYWWMFCVHHNGFNTQLYQRRIFVHWKPLLMFIKGKKIKETVRSFSDFIESTPVKKEYHKWQQSITEAEYIIKHLTVENQIILDPFLGSGTSAMASLNLNRQFVGCEVDKETFELAEKRISKYLNPRYN